MSEIKQYDTEVRLEAVMGTNHYGVHIHAMTKEDLHSKSDIAVELAWRDLRIEQLIAQLEAAQRDRDLHYRVSEKLRIELIATEAELSAAREKLLKPVKLPITNGYWDAEEQAFERGILLARQEIRIAGFRVEGDE